VLPRNVCLDAKRAAATATAGGIRIIELEAGTMETFDVVDFRAIHVQQAGFVDKNLQAVKLEDGVILIIEVLVEAHSVRESGTSAADYLDPEPGKCFGLIQEDFLHLFFGLLR
jgi:hypothetical protein